MKSILLITDGFPYDDTEKPFLLSEINELSKQFKIDIVARIKEKNIDKQPCCILPDSITHYKYITENVSRKEKIEYFTRIVVSKAWWSEALRLFREKRKLADYINSYEYLIRSFIVLDWIKKELILGSYDIVYTYWNSFATLALAIYKSGCKNIRLVTRTHGYDLYNERARGNRQCYKEYVNKYVDRVFFIASTGKEYYIEHFNKSINENEKLIVAPIGASVASHIPSKANANLLVSCSRMIPLKRIDMIVEALSTIDDIQIRWIHLGGGTEYDNIKELCIEKLGTKENITYELLGILSNEEVRDFYDSNFVDCFISTSESEGSPVSMQEALAYGIPIIGTNVGEVAELTRDSGILLDSNPEIEEIVDAIKLVLNMDEEDVKRLRTNAYNKWQDYYDAEKNAKKFAMMLSKLTEDDSN